MKFSVATAFALCEAVAAVQQTVDLGYSSFKGTVLDNGITQWLGMPFAAPPVGDLRWRAPRDPAKTQGIQDASKNAPSCIGTGETANANKSEDCLYASVFAPTKATRCSPLPVYVWIMGGGFNQNSGPNSNGTGLIKAAEEDLVVVTFNYRVGTYGFMSNGDTDSEHIDTNMGLLDQRKLLHWVHDNISKFGGDPRRVVIGGASAGGASVTYQLTAYDGKDEGLFAGAAAQSQSFGPVRTAAKSRYQFVNLAKKLGCWDDNHAAGLPEDDKSNDAAILACMRAAPVATIQEVNKNIPYPEIADRSDAKAPLYMWSPMIDGDFIKDLTYTRFREGRYVHVPTIFGDDTNEGTGFAPQTAASQSDSHAFFRAQFPAVTDAQLTVLDELYPNANQSTCPNAGCWWRQAADLYGETRYNCPGLFLAETLSSPSTPSPARTKQQPLYLYQYDVLDPAQEAAGLGVPHTVETFAIWGPENLVNAAPKSYLPGGINAGAIPVMQGYWTSFMRSLDPSAHRAAGSAEWTAWTGGYDEGKRVYISTGGKTAMEKVEQHMPGQVKRCEYLETIAIPLEQ
ncbi:Alpha/Beta hydrolase protein [Microdochium bolleyi]|uniref:Carboxylic ester hydrolase n=1 Tax=Microdochium bolleyi TaxID=196109 RepID=A0A136INC0_9PEZI|nr:Alpha/Beta hydrolase protein [Microdochium bolleyi]